jgi:quercetin dioxygenase-like cupin family protein
VKDGRISDTAVTPTQPAQRARRPTPARERVAFRRLSHLSNMEVLRTTYITHAFAKHTHEEFAIGVIERGVHASEWGGATHLAGPGDIIVNNPGDIHTGHPHDENGWSYQMIYPPADMLHSVASQLADRPQSLPAFARATASRWRFPATAWCAATATRVATAGAPIASAGSWSGSGRPLRPRR